MSSLPANLPLKRASDLESAHDSQDIIETLAGRLIELESDAAGGALTATSILIRKVQEKQQDAVWISATKTLFFPPDFASNGLDLDRLPIVRTTSATSAAHAADHLLRSEAFRLLVLDLADHTDISLAQQGRIVQLAGKKNAIVLFLTDRNTRRRAEGGSFGSLVSLHGVASHTQKESDRFRLSVRVTKDKRNGPGWMWQEVCHGPVGLC